jgi:hypothetical protein
MNIKATYDQTITKAIRNDDGCVIGHEPTTHHYTFGSVGSELSGGFYLKAGDELPKMIHLKDRAARCNCKSTGVRYYRIYCPGNSAISGGQHDRRR